MGRVQHREGTHLQIHNSDKVRIFPPDCLWFVKKSVEGLCLFRGRQSQRRPCLLVSKGFHHQVPRLPRIEHLQIPFSHLFPKTPSGIKIARLLKEFAVNSRYSSSSPSFFSSYWSKNNNLIRASVEDDVVKGCARRPFGKINLSRYYDRLCGLCLIFSRFYPNYRHLHGNYSENTIRYTPIRSKYCTDTRFEVLQISQ